MATTDNDAGGAQGKDASGGIPGDDETEIVKQWTMLFGGLFAAIGAGIGLFLILLDAIDVPIEEVSDEASQVGQEVTAYANFAGQPAWVQLPPILVIVATGFLGIFLAWQLDVDDQTVYKTTAAAGVAAAVAAWLLVAILGTVPADESSVDYVGIVVNAILAGVGAAVAGAGSAYLARNQTPDGVDVGSASAGGAPLGDD